MIGNDAPLLIFAPTYRVFREYCAKHHLFAPRLRFVDSERRVIGVKFGTSVICLVGDQYGTVDVTPRSAALAERLIEHEAMGRLRLIYRWWDDPPI